jgi:hypothetical protein
MKDRKFIAEYEKGVYASNGAGGRTLHIGSAKRFKSSGAAKAAITHLKKCTRLTAPMILVEYEGYEPCIYEYYG